MSDSAVARKMSIPDRREAEAWLSEGGRLNPGPWVQHSLNVAYAASLIAAAAPGLDGQAAYVLGCLHDIGRRFGVSGMRHVLDGYRFLTRLGYPDAARISLTHSYPLQDVMAISGEVDCSPAELSELESLLVRIEYDAYDQLIQLCDALAMASGFVLIEKRLVDVALRYGCSDFSIKKWEAILALKAHFDQRVGGNLYSLLPGIVSTTFGFPQAGEV